jgi:ABC-type dipeptide/oligopeptide/nickel transport system permease subunit
VAQPTSLSPLDVQRAPEGGDVGAVQSGWRLAWREFSSNRLALIGVGLLLFFILFSWVGPLIYHTDQLQASLANANQSPSASHLLGTDAQGFDVLGRMMKGGQNALLIGLFSALMAIVIGALVGAASGLLGGIVDAVLMRITDVFLSVPFLFVVLILAVRYSPPTVFTLSAIIAVFSWQTPARLVRGEVLTLRERDFVLAARTAGAGNWRLILRHLLPNSIGLMLVNATFQVSDAILAIASIGFLGFGLQYPNVDWGDELSGSIGYLQDGYWYLIFPVGACIVLTVMALNFIGDAARDAMDVRLRRR